LKKNYKYPHTNTLKKQTQKEQTNKQTKKQNKNKATNNFEIVK
jgi:hypothetical protein